jgi:isoleucyl-tRNA synthetase
VRLPLAGLTIVTDDAANLAEFEAILRDELNVKNVTFVDQHETSAAEFGITSRLTVNARVAGPRLGKSVQQAIKGARTGDWNEANGVVNAGGIDLLQGEYELVLEAAAESAEGESGHSTALALLPSGGFVLLDTTLTPALEAEGLARDIIRAVQDARKSAGFEVSDRIVLDLVFFGPADADAVRGVSGAVRAEEGSVDIAGETLATALAVHGPAETPAIEGFRTLSPAEWLGGISSSAPEHYVRIAGGKYANSDDFVIAVSRDAQSRKAATRNV